MKVSDVLTSERRRAGVTQSELSRLTGVSRPLVSSYEHDRNSPSVEQMTRLLSPLGVELSARPVMSREDRRSLGFALRVVDHLRNDPERTLEVARGQLARQRKRATVNELPWLDVWAAILALPVSVVCSVLADEGQFARDLRQSSPMSVVLDEDESDDLRVKMARSRARRLEPMGIPAVGCTKWRRQRAMALDQRRAIAEPLDWGSGKGQAVEP